LKAIVLWFQGRFKRSEIRFRSGVISSELYAPIAIFRDFSVFSPQKIIPGPSPIWVWRWKLHFPLSFGKSFMKIRSAVPENGCLIFMHYRCGGRKKKQKKTKKTSVKHIRIRAP